MLDVAAILGLIASIIAIAEQIVKLAENAQREREKCTLLLKRVDMIHRLLKHLQSSWAPDPVTSSVLENLRGDLNDAMALLHKCQKKRTWSHIYKTQKKAKEFDAIDKRINGTLALFPVANMTLIVSINNERFFMHVIHTLIEDGACTRLPQREKEDLKSSIARLTNTENMSSEAQRVLERITKDLNSIRDDEAETSRSSPAVPPRGHRRGQQQASTSTDDVRSLALSILEKAQALGQNRVEIQLLVQFLQQLAGLMQHLQSDELSQNPRAKNMVDGVLQSLQEADMILSTENPRRRRSRRTIAQAFLCGGAGAGTGDGGDWLLQPDHEQLHIIDIAYEIGYHAQAIPVIMRQIYRNNSTLSGVGLA